MKHLIPVLFFIIILTGSCEKERCWKCAWEEWPDETMTVCDKTEKEIVQYEKDMRIELDDGTTVDMNCHSY